MTRRRETFLALLAAGLVLALLAVFAIELSGAQAGTQARSRSAARARLREQSVLFHQQSAFAATLIDGLFETVETEVQVGAPVYGTRNVARRTLDENRGLNLYLALLGPRGKVLAHSSGFTAQARANLRASAALALVRAGRPYGLGNLLPYGKSRVIDFAVTLPTRRYGRRTLVAAFSPVLMSTWARGVLSDIRGVPGASKFLLDGDDVVLASTSPAIRAYSRVTAPSRVKALARPSGHLNGQQFDEASVSNSGWRTVLAAPDGAPVKGASGPGDWLPWAILVAFALVALVALLLAARWIRAARAVREAKSQLELVNHELAATIQMLERRADALARSNTELEQFASIASHDLQEPLRKVRTFIEQLSVTDYDRLSEQGRDYAQRANLAAARMQDLIEDLLMLSRVATHGRQFAPVDLGRITREVLEDLELQVQGSGAQVIVGGLPTISADAPQLRQLMQNLISNALKFRRQGVAPEVRIDSKTAGGTVQVTVRDNGIGFDPRYSERIFRVFERLNGRSEYPGTGIGLALCRKIAERHGGSVVADSEPGVGSTLTVTLPLSRREEGSTGPDPIEDLGPRAPRERFAHA